ncbi:hypothetical protein GCM10027199_22930 [Amycolatopsis magusensis]
MHFVVLAVPVAVDRRGHPDVVADDVGRVEHRLRLSVLEDRPGGRSGLGGYRRYQRHRQQADEHSGKACGSHTDPL